MIFLFHAKEDEDTAEIIQEQLAEIDEVEICAENDNLTPTEDRINWIDSSIRKAGYIMVLFSSHAFLKRKQNELLIEFKKVLAKIKHFSANKRNFFPVRIDDCDVPLQIQNDHFYHLFEEGGLEQIIRIISQEQEEKDDADQETKAEGDYFFYKDNWKWIIQFDQEQVIGNHKYHAGFTYLHFILGSGLSSVYIDSLKKVSTKIYRPERYELLGLDEDGDEIEADPADREKNSEERQEDAKLFTQISDEIIFAMQSIKNQTIQAFFFNAIQFLGNGFIYVNNYLDGKKIPWQLYK